MYLEIAMGLTLSESASFFLWEDWGQGLWSKGPLATWGMADENI